MQKPSELKPWMKLWGDNLPNLEDASCTVYEFIYRANHAYGDGYAINYFDHRITHAEFFENVQKTAKAYRELGVRAGDIVTFCTVMTPETIYSFYALSLIGATLNMTDPRTTAFGLKDYIMEVKSKVVVTLNIAYPKIKEAVKDTCVEKVISVSPACSLSAFKKLAYSLANPDKNQYDDNVILWDKFIKNAENANAVAPVPYDPNHAILIMHTGGTTGKPKGVLLSDRNINSLALQMYQKRGTRGQRFLNIMPPFIAYGYGTGVHTPMSCGVEVILIPNFDPTQFGKLLKKYRPEHMAGVPLHYQMLINDPAAKKLDLSFLVSTGAGGDAISEQAEMAVNEFLKSHNATYLLDKGYGMTEVSAAATACIREINKKGSVGIPMCFTTVGIFEPNTDNELDFNTPGEICFNTPGMMLGYYNMPEETAKVIRKHSDGKLWVHTGDIGTMDEEGYIYIVNRIKRVIIRHDGFKVFPSAIENVVNMVDGVAGSCAVPVKDVDHKQGDLPFVYLLKHEDYTGSMDELKNAVREICTKELAEYVQPVGYEFIESLPYTGIGKVDYLALQEKAKSVNYKE